MRLPVKKSAFDNIISTSYRTGFGYRTDGTFYETAPLSDDDVSGFAEVVKSINNAYSCDSRIREIMHESLDEYFSGRIKVNEAAERIQNKVSLYLDEIR